MIRQQASSGIACCAVFTLNQIFIDDIDQLNEKMWRKKLPQFSGEFYNMFLKAVKFSDYLAKINIRYKNLYYHSHDNPIQLQEGTIDSDIMSEQD